MLKKKYLYTLLGILNTIYSLFKKYIVYQKNGILEA